MGNVLLLMLLGAVWTLVSYALGAASMLWYLRHRPMQEVQAGDKRCEICFEALPIGAIRTHHGHWRCAEHKGTS